MRIGPALPLLLPFLLLAACDKPSSSSTPPTPTANQFHISIFNACMNDVTVEVGAQAGGGRQVLLFKDARETITGGRELVFLLGKGGEVLATYQPIEGNQKAQVTSDCTAIERLN